MASCCPKTFTGFCLADNTPIAVTIDNGVLISWTNLVTGVVTVGNPPAGTGICEVPSVVTVDIEPLTCAKDSITICPGVDPIIVSVIEPVTVDAVDFDIRNLTCATDEVTVCQGTSPWVVSGTVSVTEPVTVDGTVALDAATLAALETITVNQGISPWVVSGTDLDIRNLACGQDAVDACVTFDYAEDSPHVSGDIGAFVLAVRNDAGLPLAGDGDYIPLTTDPTGALRVNASFSGDITVALDCATDSVTICPGDDPIVVSGIVSITESVTVDAVDFDIRNLDCATDSITVCPGGDPLPVSGTISTFEASLVPKGYQQLTPTASTALTVPLGAVYALLQARIADISYRDDGVAPTGLVGMRIVIDNSIFYTGNLASLLFISALGKLDVLYYGPV